jgi:hypothetical protein
MQTKIVRLHDRTRNRRSESLAGAELRELRRLIAQQDRVIADLIMDMRELKRSVPPLPFGFDPRDNR